jgi:hypothetical protein
MQNSVGNEENGGGSKMVTRVQKQTAWAPWIKNFVEMLESHIAERKHQEESKLRHTEPLAHGKLLHATLHWENGRAPTATRHQLQTCLGDIQQTKQISTKHYSPNLLGKTSIAPWADWPTYKKNPNWIKNKLKTSTQQIGQKPWKWTREGG